MEDLSRFSGPARKSSRLASYYATSTGAAAGLAKALARASGNQAPLAARTVPTARTVTTGKPKPSTSATEDRVKVVAEALERDPALKGKAKDALAMLADNDLSGLTGAGVVKSLKAGVTASPPTPAPRKTTAPVKTQARASTRAAVPAPKAASTSIWDKAIASMGKPPEFAASKASMSPWEKAIGKMKAPF